MTSLTLVPVPPVAQLEGVSQHYGKTVALNNITLDIPARSMVGLIGPDGVGKSSLLSLISGARVIEQGNVIVLGGDMRDAKHRRDVCPRIAWMPQGLGKNLYHTLSVYENVDFFARLFGHDKAEREARITELLNSTGLAPFRDRPAGKLSGGMKQKLGLCCALIHDPELLILDEPTTGVDPLSRAQFWDLIDSIRQRQTNMSVLVATAYMEEAERFDWLVAMNAGEILATGSAQQLRAKTHSATLEQAFIALLPEAQRQAHKPVVIPPYHAEQEEIAIEAKDLTMRFGKFVAVDHVNFRIPRGEIFGFLGSNGCGKSTTMKMLTGLLPASEGQAWLFGQPVDPNDIDTRRRVGYMSQAFSLYNELTVRQNLELHARLFHIPPAEIPARVAQMIERFMLTEVEDTLPASLPLGIRQRLSLAVAVIHRPFDAATGVINDSGTVTATNAFRRFHAARKYAAGGAGYYADHADDAFCQPCPGYSLSRRRFEHRLAAVPDPAGDRRRVLPDSAVTLQKNDWHDGVNIIAGWRLRLIRPTNDDVRA